MAWVIQASSQPCCRIFLMKNEWRLAWVSCFRMDQDGPANSDDGSALNYLSHSESSWASEAKDEVAESSSGEEERNSNEVGWFVRVHKVTCKQGLCMLGTIWAKYRLRSKIQISAKIQSCLRQIHLSLLRQVVLPPSVMCIVKLFCRFQRGLYHPSTARVFIKYINIFMLLNYLCYLTCIVFKIVFKGLEQNNAIHI